MRIKNNNIIDFWINNKDIFILFMYSQNYGIEIKITNFKNTYPFVILMSKYY